MMRFILLFFVFISAFNINAQLFTPIKIDEAVEGKYPPSEPSIVISRKNQSNIVAAAILDKVYVSLDSGKTWEFRTVESSYGVFGDPMLISDKKGDIYFFHLSDPEGEENDNENKLDRMVVQKSSDGGLSWDNGSYVGLNPPTDQDKQTPIYSKKNNEIYLSWTQFDKYGSKNPEDESNIMFSSSSNGGKKWSQPIKINKLPGDCLDGDGTAMGGYPAINKLGHIFVVYALDEKIYMDRSFDKGKMWLRNDLEIEKQPGGWNFEIPALGRANGLPTLKIDQSNSSLSGSIYLLWSDQSNGENDTDIFLKKSTRTGDIWSSKIRVNQDTTQTHQFFPAMTVDEANGMLYVVYYDRRNHNDEQTDVYFAYSFDGGNNFKELKLNSTSFKTKENKFFGDYIAIDAYKGVIAPVWTQMDESGKTSIWTTVILAKDLLTK